jgi:small subunit ribosomal protein S4e
LVDGKVRKEPRFTVGFMDVVCVPVMERSYRVLLDYRGRLILSEISKEESSVKLCKVGRKQILKGRKVQLTLHDGKNLTGELNSFKPGDVVKLALPDFKILERLPMESGSLVFITGGKNTSRVGRIEEIKVTPGPQPNMVVLKLGEDTFEAPQAYVFVVGKEKPEVSIPGAVL